MSFHPPNTDIYNGGAGFVQPPNMPYQQDFNHVNHSLQNLSLRNASTSSITSNSNTNANAKRKRPARAFHTLTPQSSTPNLNQHLNVNPPSQPHNSNHKFGSPNMNYPYGQSLSHQMSTPNLHSSAQYANNSQPFLTPQQPQFPFHESPHLGSQAQSSMNQIPQFQEQKTEIKQVNATVPLNPGQAFQPDAALSVPGQRYTSQEEFLNTKFYTFQNVAPPPAGTQFSVVDQGTASSKFMRSTMYTVPQTEALRNATKLPLGLTVRPFAPHEFDDEDVPEVDLREIGGPPRCRRCRTYINSSMQHTRDYKFICNMCQFPNLTPSEYTSPLDPSGKRMDHFQRPELHKSVIDFVVPDEYFVGDIQPKAMHHLFLIDVSEEAIKNQIPALAVDAIRSTLFGYSEKAAISKGCKIAIVTFDRSVNFYNLDASLEQSQLSIMSDLDDPFVPFYKGLFVDPEESSAVIEHALHKIESSSDFVQPEPALGPALRAAQLALKEVGGGKITTILSSLPSWGPGGLSIKDADVKRITAELEKEVFLPDNTYYQQLQTDFIKNNIGFDLFVISSNPVDLSNLGNLCSKTGGVLKLYQNFKIFRDQRNVISDIKASISNTSGYQGQLKVRCSNGLQVAKYYGGHTPSDLGDPIIPVLSTDQTFSVLFSYDGKLNTKLDAHFQAALLYTSKDGVRKVRVINLVLAVSERLNDIFAFSDQDAILTTIIRDTIYYVGKQPLTELRESTNNKLVEVCCQYKALSTEAIPPNQLVFPDSLRTFVSYILAFQKTKLLRGVRTNTDSRIAAMLNMYSMPIERLVYYVYPVLIELHSIGDYEAVFHEDGKFVLPQAKSCTASSLLPGCYFMFNGERLLLSVHPSSNPLLIKDLFGENVEHIQDLDPLMDELPDVDTQISLQARNIVKYFARVAGKDFLGFQLSRIGIDGSENEFNDMLVEDRTPNKNFSYPDYLVHIHKAIKIKLENEKFVKAPEHEHETLAQRMIHF